MALVDAGTGSDCWIQNLVPTPDDLSSYQEQRNAPPATKAYAHADAHQPSPNPNTVHFDWAPDGDSVALFFDGVLSGFMTSSSKRGFSRNLAAIGPFGSPIDRDLFNSLFNRPSIDGLTPRSSRTLPALANFNVSLP
jgi:hypothetical protein